MRNRIFIIIQACVLAMCFCGCERTADARLLKVDRLCDSVPQEAVDSFAAIDPRGLSERDLNRWRLLWIKTRDKAYIAHKSDTLILDVVDYYDRHRSEGLYPEALYYGGRVYSDLGDLPTALEFFQKSLDEIPDDDAHLRFKSNVLNQTGRLLYTLRLDSAAIGYLEKSLEINKQILKVNHNDAFTHHLIASSFRRMNKIKYARKHIDAAVRLSSNLSESDRRTFQTEFAYTLYKEGKLDSAITVLRPLPCVVDSITLPFCLAIAADMYKDAGILDTAYFFARQLTQLKNPNNKKTGYKVIFSEELKPYVSKDTLLKLIPEYKREVEQYLNTHNAEQALIQNARYNYSTHVREREISERKLRSMRLKLWVTGGILTIITLAILSVFLWIMYGKAKKNSSLMRVLLLTEKVKETVRQLRHENREENDEDVLANEIANPVKAKERILAEIISVKESNPLYLLSLRIKESQVYRDLREKAEKKEEIDECVSWKEIEELVKSDSPDFEIHLDILSESPISFAERKVAYLMKLGFSNTQIANLLGRLPGTVSNQRSSIARKIGCKKSEVDTMVMRL